MGIDRIYQLGFLVQDIPCSENFKDKVSEPFGGMALEIMVGIGFLIISALVAIFFIRRNK